jgi:SH3 domain-containing YSC84-like protein 1
MILVAPVKRGPHSAQRDRERKALVTGHGNRWQLRNVGRVASLAILVCLLVPVWARAASDDQDARLKQAGDVLKDMFNGESHIPVSVLNKAECVIVLPSVKKGGFILAAQYGKGAMSCRSGENFDGPWSAPIMMQSSGGSFGFQAGGQATDYVVLVMNDKGARTMLHGKAKLGGDASVAAGPVGKTAEAATNASMSAEMLSYSHSQGAFAGVSLSGTSLGPDAGDNEKLYGKKITGEEIFAGSVEAPQSASLMLSMLKEKSPKPESKGKS